MVVVAMDERGSFWEWPWEVGKMAGDFRDVLTMSWVTSNSSSSARNTAPDWWTRVGYGVDSTTNCIGQMSPDLDGQSAVSDGHYVSARACVCDSWAHA